MRMLADFQVPQAGAKGETQPASGLITDYRLPVTPSRYKPIPCTCDILSY